MGEGGWRGGLEGSTGGLQDCITHWDRGICLRGLRCVGGGHGRCPTREHGSPGNQAVGCCHHPLGPHQEAPTGVLPVHLDGGDEGPGVRCHHPSSDDPAPLGAWWVSGCRWSPAAGESGHHSHLCLSCSWLCVLSTPALPVGAGEPPISGSGPGPPSVAVQSLPCTAVFQPRVSTSHPSHGDQPCSPLSPSSPVTCWGQCWEQDGASQAEDEQPGHDHAGAAWATATASGASWGGGAEITLPGCRWVSRSCFLLSGCCCLVQLLRGGGHWQGWG